MESTQDSQQRTIKAKRSVANPPPLNPGQGGPTTFFLRSEKDIEKSVPRGRKASRDSIPTSEDSMQKTPMASTIGDSAFGVQSLEETVSSTASSENLLSRTSSNLSEASVDGGADVNVLAGRKRKAGNPVHPKIIATGQRILSSEHTAQAAGSPMSHRSADSPYRTNARRHSISSSVNLSQPLTPLKMSPRPESAMPSTPRSGSPKSFRLSDEEQSIASDTGSQAIQSSGSEDNEEDGVADGKANAMPQLVMPSIAMPTRRPFTEKGKQMGRLRLMVVGPKGVGKTSLIQSICRVCEDVVHMDPINGTSSTLEAPQNHRYTTTRFVEVGASTRPYPSWWTDFESRRMLLRRKSMGDGVLERNLAFLDTPGIGGDDDAGEILKHFKTSLARIGNMTRMHDSELISMLSGEGGVQIDAVLYLFDPATGLKDLAEPPQMHPQQAELLQYLCKWTNVIPLVGRCDTMEAKDLVTIKKQLLNMFLALGAEPYISHSLSDGQTNEDQSRPEEPAEPYAVSSALGDDSETIDASILMSSSYLPPLIASELDIFVSRLFDPDNMAKLRHLSATKFLLWRQGNLGSHIDLQKQALLSSTPFEPTSPAITTADSIAADDPSKVLVPHASSSYYRSVSPGASDSSALSANNNAAVGTSTQALARYNEQTNNTSAVPFRQVRLAKWAQDLQRSLDNERRRYKQMFTSPPSDWMASDSEKAATGAEPTLPLTTTNHNSRPAKGHLGGDLGIIDPRDPLGVLSFSQSFSRKGLFALQIAGSCGLIGAVVWWVAKNWIDVQEFLGLTGWQSTSSAGAGTAVTMTAVPAVSTGAGRGWFDDANWRNLLGWER